MATFPYRRILRSSRRLFQQSLLASFSLSLTTPSSKTRAITALISRFSESYLEECYSKLDTSDGLLASFTRATTSTRIHTSSRTRNLARDSPPLTTHPPHS